MSADEPNENEDLSEESFAQIEEICDAFLVQLKTGEAEGYQNLVDSHPELAPQLESRLKIIEAVFRIATSDSKNGSDPKNGSESANGSGSQATSGDAEDGRLADDSEQSTFLNPHERIVYRQKAKRIGCPHCGNVVQLVEGAKAEVTCNSCGSNVTVDNEATATDLQNIPALIGRFQVIRLLGEGSFGAVFLAHDPQLRREVAIKAPRVGYFQTAGEEQRFLREAQSAAKLHHPNIVPVYEVSQDAKNPFIVSKFIDGITLGDLASNGLLTFKEIANLMIQICDAVNYAHENGVIHRDLKPGNLLVDHQKQAFVADFGLARRDDAEITMTVDGMILGTPAYMPPEQAAGMHDKVDARSDIYALGVVLYKLITRELPFSGTRRMLLHQVIHEEPRGPRKLNDNIPRDLETITLKAISKSPEARFQSAKELSDELRRWSSDQPIRSRPVSAAAKLWKWCRRNPVVATLCVSVAGLLMTGFLYAQYKAIREASLRSIADANAGEAIEQKKQSEARLHQIYQQKAHQAFDENRLIEAGHWYSKSLEIVDRESDRERVRMLFDRIPALQGAFPADSKVSAIVFEKDDRLLAIGTVEGEVQVVNLATREVVFRQKMDEPYPVFDIKFLLSGSSIAFRTSRSTVQIWDVENNRLVKEITHQDPAPVLVTDSEGKFLFTGGDGVAQIWNVQDASLVREFDQWEAIKDAIFIDDAKTLIVQTQGDFFEPTTNRSVCELSSTNIESGAVAWSQELPFPAKLSLTASGKRIVSVSQAKRVSIRDTVSGEQIGKTIEPPVASVTQCIQADDAQVTLIVDSDTVQTWDYLKAEQVGVPRKFDFDSKKVAHSRNGKVLAVAENDGSIRFLDRIDLTEVVSRVPNHDVSPRMVFDIAGNRIAIEGNGVVQIWNLAAGVPEYIEIPHEERVSEIRFSPDGKRFYTAGDNGLAMIWDCRTGERIGAEMKQEDSIRRCAISSDGQLFATASLDNQAMVWDAESGIPFGKSLPHPAAVTCLAFSPDNKRLITGCGDGTIYCWKISANLQQVPKPVFTISHESNVGTVRFDPSGKFIASSSHDGLEAGSNPARPSPDGSIRCWDAESGVAKYGPFKQPGIVLDYSFSPNGERLVSSHQNGSVCVWNVQTGEKLQLLDINSDAAHVEFPTESKIVTSDFSGRTILWEKRSDSFVKTNQLVHPIATDHNYFDIDTTLQRVAVCAGKESGKRGFLLLWQLDEDRLLAPAMVHPDNVLFAYFSPTGQQIGSVSQDGVARIWNLSATHTLSESANVFEVLHRLTQRDPRIPQNDFVSATNRILADENHLFEVGNLANRIWKKRFTTAGPSSAIEEN
ncbi:protein kinase domain-containing protein [Mariniblastus fucicola]|uniref:non-specific serine/threonine protein kinase n=1 Tax=Mariniblastus fucicola TaxID=980251 RepID=A0A5B9P4M7_9BACT|nr:protein kinase [Mariniblastus fucicola]QEG21557.1 Serine/threonine-protein kinase PknB [Mariniblastus fucicola]